MRYKHPSIRQILALALIPSLLIVGGIPAVSQLNTSRSKTRLRPRLSTEERLQRFMAKQPGENPYVPVIMHSIGRYLSGATDPSEIDRVVWNVLRARPRLTRQMLQTAIDNWQQITESVRARIVPAEFRSLNPARKLETSDLRSALDRRLDTLTGGQNMGAPRPGNRRWGQGVPVISAITSQYGTDAGTTKVLSGQPFSIAGKGFSPAHEKNSILIYRTIAPANKYAQAPLRELVTQFTPVTAAPALLVAKFPPSLQPGVYQVNVNVEGRGESNFMALEVPSWELPPKLAVKSVTPAPYPDYEITIVGQGFPQQTVLHLDNLDDPDRGSYNNPVTWVNDTKLKWIVHPNMDPGNYRIAVMKKGDGLDKVSNWLPFVIRAPKYKVEFKKIECLDLSDPEYAKDEIRVGWAIGADPNYTWTKVTGVYEDFHEDESRPFDAWDSKVFVPQFYQYDPAKSLPWQPPQPDAPEQWQKVSRHLVIATTVWEWGSGDSAQWGEALMAIGAAIAVIGAQASSSTAIYLGVLIAAIGAVATIASDEPSCLGVKVLPWTDRDLQNMTKNIHTVEGTLDFLNDDDTGSYRLHYTVYRKDE